MGMGALEPLEAAEEFVFLHHAPCVTLSKERLIEPRLRGSVREPPEPQWLRAHLLVPGPWLPSESQREPRIGSRLLLIGEPEARASGRALSRGNGRARARPDSLV